MEGSRIYKRIAFLSNSCALCGDTVSRDISEAAISAIRFVMSEMMV